MDSLVNWVNLLHWMLIGPFLIYLGYVKGEAHPILYTFIFTIGVLVTIYHLYKCSY